MNCKMVLFAVLVLIGTCSLYGQKPVDEEPDPYLLWQTTNGYTGFVIHPNGNIIANRDAEIFELDGNTGQVLRTFPQFVHTNVDDMDITKDGKILGAGLGNIILYDLENDTVIDRVSNTGGPFAFFPDSKRFVAGSTNLFTNNLFIYNRETKEKTIFEVNYAVWAVATSPDGKYFATGGTKTEKDLMGDEIKYLVFTLWDAATLIPIKEMGKFYKDFVVRSIKFSPDGKYVGFQVSNYFLYIYKLNNLNLYKYYDFNFIESGVSAFCFLGNDYFMARTGSTVFGEPRKLTLINLISDLKIKTINSGKGGPKPVIENNPFNNTLIDATGQLWAFDLNKILTSVSDEKIFEPLQAQYKKGFLMLSNFNTISSQINITISDINGRVIKRFDSQVTNSELRIPLKLLNGTYLLHIQDGNKVYSSKFLVSE